jgi:hypothetical protein
MHFKKQNFKPWMLDFVFDFSARSKVSGFNFIDENPTSTNLNCCTKFKLFLLLTSTHGFWAFIFYFSGRKFKLSGIIYMEINTTFQSV